MEKAHTTSSSSREEDEKMFIAFGVNDLMNHVGKDVSVYNAK